MNENVCKKHITKLNKNFTSSYFYDHNNKENEEITNNVIDSIDEGPLNNFDQNESPILLSDSPSPPL